MVSLACRVRLGLAGRDDENTDSVNNSTAFGKGCIA